MSEDGNLGEGCSYCDRCGRKADGVLGDEALCEDCYHAASSCCGVFGDEKSQFCMVTMQIYVIA